MTNIDDTDDDTSTTMWVFLVDDQERIRRWPMGSYNAFHATNRVRQGDDGEWHPILVDPIPEFVGLTQVRYILLGLRLRNRKPVDCFLTECNVQYLDGQGRPNLEMENDRLFKGMAMMDHAHQAYMADAQLPPALAADRKRFAQRRTAVARAKRDAIHRWVPSDAVWAAVRAAVYGPGQ